MWCVSLSVCVPFEHTFVPMFADPKTFGFGVLCVSVISNYTDLSILPWTLICHFCSHQLPACINNCLLTLILDRRFFAIIPLLSFALLSHCIALKSPVVSLLPVSVTKVWREGKNFGEIQCIPVMPYIFKCLWNKWLTFLLELAQLISVFSVAFAGRVAISFRLKDCYRYSLSENGPKMFAKCVIEPSETCAFCWSLTTSATQQFQQIWF